jgi:hypothetical protein
MEEWKNIKGYEGLYQVSNLGRIRNKNNNIKVNNLYKNGYLYVDLYKYGKRKRKLVHRLVAQAFIKNVNDYPQINHIDGNKKNNNAENLEWCTCSHNIKEAYRLNLRKVVKPMLGKKGDKCPTSKKIFQYDKKGNYIRSWCSTMDVERELKIRHSHITDCCKNKKHYKTAGGYIWKYAEEE